MTLLKSGIYTLTASYKGGDNLLPSNDQVLHTVYSLEIFLPLVR